MLPLRCQHDLGEGLYLIDELLELYEADMPATAGRPIPGLS